MPAPLENFLHLVTSGNVALTPEMYQHFGGDAILAALQKYDPNARFNDVKMGSQEGGEGEWMGKQLAFDASKLPTSKGGMAGYDLNPSNLHENVMNKGGVYEDDAYGSVTNSANFAPDKVKLWTKIAPLLVTMGAPMAGGALAGMGIGGAAGLTAGVTGSGLGGAASIPSWAAKIVGQAPSLAKSYGQGGENALLSSILNMALGMGGGALGSAAGINPNLVKGALTLGQLARKR